MKKIVSKKKPLVMPGAFLRGGEKREAHGGAAHTTRFFVGEARL
jgi:hypothetical protein